VVCFDASSLCLLLTGWYILWLVVRLGGAVSDDIWLLSLRVIGASVAEIGGKVKRCFVALSMTATDIIILCFQCLRG